MTAEAWQLERHLRRNLAAVALWEVFWGFGAACVSGAILQAFLAQLTGSKTLIGALGLTNLLALPALFASAYANRRLRQKRRFAAALWAAQVLNWVLLGAGVALSDGRSVAPIVALLFVTHALIYVANGLVVAPTYELLAAIFGRRWGLAQGVQLLANRLCGTAGGLVAAAVLAQYPFPLGFGLTFLLGGAFLTVSNASLLLMVEPPSYGGGGKQPPFGAYLRGLLASIAADPQFGRLLVVLVLLAFVGMAQGFYVVYALETLRLPASYAGLFTTITFATTGLGGAVAGPLGDLAGHRRLLLAGLALHLASLVAVQTLGGLWGFSAALALSGLAAVAAGIATSILTAELAPPGEKGSYTAATRLVVAPAAALATFAGGALIDGAGYGTVFSLALVFPLAALAATRRLDDPRRALAR